MKLYALQVRKNDRWVFCSYEGRIIVSQDREAFADFGGDRWRTIEFKGLIDCDEWINCQTEAPYENGSPTRYEIVVNGTVPPKEKKLRFETIANALFKFEASPGWSRGAIITMGPQHHREFRVMNDADNRPVLNIPFELGDQRETLFGYTIEVKPNTERITIKDPVSGVMYTLF